MRLTIRSVIKSSALEIPSVAAQEVVTLGTLVCHAFEASHEAR